MTQTSVVHLVAKTHLDLGFTALASEVRDRYLKDFFPRALGTSAELAGRAGPEALVWTTGSWIIDQALGQQDRSRAAAVEAGIEAGHLAWHALPVTTHTELMDADLARSSLGICRRLDDRFGRRTTAAKMTDVPGHTRGLVPLLAEAGVTFLHLGVNPAWPLPDVPPVFRWVAPDGSAVTVAYQAGGYGGEVRVPGCGHVLAFLHTGDNLGPPTADEVVAAHAEVAARHPGAEVRASTLDAFARALAESGAVADLPEVTAEIGDPWLFGAGSDPQKLAAYRALLADGRRRGDGAGDGHGDGRISAVDDALLLVAEHTWGLDQKLALPGDTAWGRADLAALRRTERGRRFESSWAEQRSYIDLAAAACDAARQIPSPQPSPAATAPSVAMGEGDPDGGRPSAASDAGGVGDGGVGDGGVGDGGVGDGGVGDGGVGDGGVGDVGGPSAGSDAAASDGGGSDGDGPRRGFAWSTVRPSHEWVRALHGAEPLDPTGSTIETVDWSIGLDPRTGAVSRLVQRRTGRVLADGGHHLGAVTYQGFDEADYERWWNGLCPAPEDVDWARWDNTKPGIDAAGAVSGRWGTRLVEAWYRPSGSGAEGSPAADPLGAIDGSSVGWGGEGAGRGTVEHELIAMLAFEGVATSLAPPPELWVRWRWSDGPAADRLAAELCWVDKPAGRLPEACWWSFVPKVAEPARWTMDKLGQAVSPLDVVAGGGRSLHAVGLDGISYSGPDGRLGIVPVDAPLVAPGRPALLEPDPPLPDMAGGWHVLLHDNCWGTNFPMWSEGSARFRTTLTVGPPP